MIPFASQRGNGQDLAAHLLNESDNEYMELADLRGSIADDLPGAFAEWEAQAQALTKCQKYLYSLSINPDHSQGEFTRDQYLDYIDRVEERLGLSSQPRAVVFHIKAGREHAHVVWSRVDAQNERAVQLAFDHQKLMMVTREFAREHGLKLPDGYRVDKPTEKTSQASQYDMAQKRATGLSKQDHCEKVKAIWTQADSPKAFVAGLAANGYMLATGKRPYLVVDFYGGMHALPRLLATRQKNVEDFLKEEYPRESLPTVQEAKSHISEYRKSLETHVDQIRQSEQRARLGRSQQKRRQELEKEANRLSEKQQREQATLARNHLDSRTRLKREYREQEQDLRQRREETKPRGLAAFLGRVTGVEFLIGKLHERQDLKRYETYLAQRQELRLSQRQEKAVQQRLHDMQKLAMQRRLNALKQVFAKERYSIEESVKKQARVAERKGGKDMPSLSKDLTPRGRKAAPHKAKTRYYKPATAKQTAPESLHGRFAGKQEEKPLQIALRKAFNERADDGKEDEGKAGTTDGKGTVAAVARPTVAFNERAKEGAPATTGEDEGQVAKKRRSNRKPRKERKRAGEQREQDSDEKSTRSNQRRRKRDNDFDKGR